MVEMEVLNMINQLGNSLTKAEIHLREKILSDWRALDWEERQRQVALHLRERHCSDPWYKAKEARYSDPMELWKRLASSCANMMPPLERHLKTFSTARQKEVETL